MSRHSQGANIPHDITAEEAVLGGILVDNQTLALLPRLEVEDFYSPKHQAVFSAMRNLEHKAEPIDLVTLEAELNRIGRWEAARDAVAAALCRYTSSENTVHYASILQHHRLSRDVAKACASVIEDVQRGDLEGDEAVRVAIQHLMAIQSRKPDPGRSVGDLIRDELESIEADVIAVSEGKQLDIGVSTGIDTLDRNTGGYPVGSVSAVLGATGHGKSTLLGNGARASAAQGDLALVYSFEDPKKFWGQRGLAQESGVPTEVIVRRRDLHLNEGRDNLRKLFQQKGAKRTEVIVPSAQWTVDQVIRDVQSRRARDTATLGRKRRTSVWIDYVQVIRLEIQRNGNREQGIANAMDRLSWLAQGCGSSDRRDECAVIAASQVKQKVIDEARAPRIDDGADSFAIAKVCKFMVGINRPSKYDDQADSKQGRIDVLKRNQGDDEVFADVELDLATHSIRERKPSDREPPPSYDWRTRD
jgi:replicative DNA helicase